jgi:5-methylcytosine-specific restriction endonuclease McrA
MPRLLYDWNAVQKYHDEGHGFVKCARRFGFTHTAWIKAIKRGRLRAAPAPFSDRRRKYDWIEIRAHYNAGATYKECQRKFGFCAQAWSKAIRRGEIEPRPATKSIGQVLSSRSSRWLKKKKLIREGYVAYHCLECGISDWLGKELVLQIDHINGIKDDWRIENVRMLCPNCHSQTPTYSGRNLKLRRLQEPGPVV